MLLREDDALLMQHRDDKPGLSLAGKWVPPGGHCEAYESMEACARRELREETGYDCSELKLLTSFIDDNVDEHAAYPLTVFWAVYDGRQPVRCFEGQEVRFIRRDQVSSYEIPSYLIEVWDQAIDARHNQLKNGMAFEKKR